MDQTFLIDLPSDITINILSRLPIKTIINCKCVCKSWCDLLKTPDFVASHLSRSVPGLIVYKSETPSNSLKLFEFKDERNELEHHESRYDRITEWDLKSFISLPHPSISIEGTVDGLVCLRVIEAEFDVLYVCNPITREVIKLPNPELIVEYPSIVTYGFGKSRTSGQYEVVRVFHECKRDLYTHILLSIPKSECHVYTLGTGSWRRTNSPGLEYEYDSHSHGVFLNGKLHWIVRDLEGNPLISCLDLEMESFSTFPLPPLQEDIRFLGSLGVLDECLCVCDGTSSDFEFVVWVMKEYGVEKSWKKEHTINKFPDFASVYGQSNYEVVYPLKLFEDGDFLMLFDDFYLFYYSDETQSAMNVLFEWQNTGRIEAEIHVPSFVSPKSFLMEADF